MVTEKRFLRGPFFHDLAIVEKIFHFKYDWPILNSPHSKLSRLEIRGCFGLPNSGNQNNRNKIMWTINCKNRYSSWICWPHVHWVWSDSWRTEWVCSEVYMMIETKLKIRNISKNLSSPMKQRAGSLFNIKVDYQDNGYFILICLSIKPEKNDSKLAI